MNEKQQVEHRQCGDVRASIRAIPTQYGELQTVLLQREWIGRDGETRYADDLRLRDLPEAIDLLGEILAAENDRRDPEASDQEAPGADEEGIPELPPSPALKRICRQDPFPSCAGLQKQPIGYSPVAGLHFRRPRLQTYRSVGFQAPPTEDETHLSICQ